MPRSRALIACALCAAPAVALADTGDDDGSPLPTDVSVDVLVVEPPCGLPDGRFGDAVCVLDWNGDGRPDLAVGAPGEGAAYVFLGTGADPPLGFVLRITAAGLDPCGGALRTDRFGAALAALPRTSGRAALVVGAPTAEIAGTPSAGAVYVVDSGLFGPPVELAAPGSGPERLGDSVAVADLDGDGRPDIAAGAPLGDVAGVAAGIVRVFPIVGEPFTIANPAPVEDGNYGHALAVADLGLDGLPDLCVSAVGNAVEGVPHRGQVFVHPGPIGSAPPVAVRAVVDPSDLPSPRFGMHIAASGDLVLVGAPREDVGPVHDGGAAHLFRFGGVPEHERFTHPTPRPADLFGFRVALADVIGGPEPDAVIGLIANQNASDPNERALWVVDLATGSGPHRIRATGGTGDHFVNGFTSGELFDGGRAEIVAGDPTWVSPLTHLATGRVLVFERR